MKDIEKVSSGKVKYDSLTGKSVIDSTISQFGPYINKILGINNRNYIYIALKFVPGIPSSVRPESNTILNY